MSITDALDSFSDSADADFAAMRAPEVDVPTPRGAGPVQSEAAHPDTVHSVDVPDLPDLGPGTPLGDMRDLRLLADVQVQLAVELGRVRLPLRDLLALTPGSVVELDRQADAPVDVLVNGRLVARGEVVVVDGEFGVRITAVLPDGA